MSHHVALAVTALAFLALASCSGIPSQAQVERARIGDPPPRDVAVRLASQALQSAQPAIPPEAVTFGGLERGFYGLGAGSSRQRFAWQLTAASGDAHPEHASGGQAHYLFFFLGERLVATAFPNSVWNGRGYRSSYTIQEFDGGGRTPEEAGLARPFVTRN